MRIALGFPRRRPSPRLCGHADRRPLRRNHGVVRDTYHDGKLVPFAALSLFAGIRPDLYEGEISKLKREHIRMDTGVTFIEPEVSKVRMKRAVTIQPNLAACLCA